MPGLGGIGSTGGKGPRTCPSISHHNELIRSNLRASHCEPVPLFCAGRSRMCAVRGWGAFGESSTDCAHRRLGVDWELIEDCDYRGMMV